MSAETLRPTTEAEVQDAVRAAGADGRRLVPVGAGTALAWARPDAESATHLSLDGLVGEGSEGVVEYIAGDGVLTAHAGARLGDLERVVREGGHRLTPRLSRAAADTTVGGLVGTGTSGLDRVAFGPLRHHVLGLRYVDGTGRLGRTGGRLVKNVTGFDLHSLFTGARGTLGAVLEVSLRLVPEPEHEVTLVWEHQGEGAVFAAQESALRLRAEASLHPRFLFVTGARLTLGLAGRRAQVEAEEATALGRVGPCREVQVGAEPARIAIDEAARGEGWVLGVRPSRCAELLSVLADAGVALEAALVEPDASRITLPVDALDGAAGDVAKRVAAVGARTLARAPGVRPDEAGLRAAGVRTFEARLRSTFDPHGVFGAPTAEVAR